MSTYLLVNLCSVVIPFVYSFHPRLRFRENWYAFWPAVGLTGALFLAWDVLYAHWGVWGFNPRHLEGVYGAHRPDDRSTRVTGISGAEILPRLYLKVSPNTKQNN